MLTAMEVRKAPSKIIACWQTSELTVLLLQFAVWRFPTLLPDDIQVWTAKPFPPNVDITHLPRRAIYCTCKVRACHGKSSTCCMCPFWFYSVGICVYLVMQFMFFNYLTITVFLAAIYLYFFCFYIRVHTAYTERERYI